MKILVLEDDYLQFELLRRHLKRFLDDIDFTRVITAKAFQEEIAKANNALPDIILIDVLVPWASADEAILPEPPEVKKSDFRGIYCAKLVAKNPKMRKIPVIIYTELDRGSRYGNAASLEEELQTLPSRFHYLRKDAVRKNLHRLIWRLTRKPVRSSS
jgi:CheY-like chemotaxis protein